MNGPVVSSYYMGRKPSGVRVAQLEFDKRTDGVKALNCAIGNVTLPMHPAMQQRLRTLGSDPASPFINGAVEYAPTVGRDDCRRAFLKVIESSGFSSAGLHVHVTDGGSTAMELAVLGVCGDPGSQEHPLLLIDAAYVNYQCFAQRTGRRTVSVCRKLDEKSGKFSLPDMGEIERVIEREHPAAILVIPYDNPTGHFYTQDVLDDLGRLAVKYNIWLIGDEAYRELYYTGQPASSVWGITEEHVPGITGRRISIETASKVWNGCGLRVGALITDNEVFHEKAVYEYTSNLCGNNIGQWIFAGILGESNENLRCWYDQQRKYYKTMMEEFRAAIQKEVPGIIPSSPDASIYSVLDVRNIVPDNFNALDFVMYCCKTGKVQLDGQDYTLLVSPLAGFYNVAPGQPNPGRTQMRVAYVETPENMQKVPKVFAGLLKQYLATLS